MNIDVDEKYLGIVRLSQDHAWLSASLKSPYVSLRAEIGGDVLLWDAMSGRLLWHRVTKYPVRDLIFSPDGRFLVCIYGIGLGFYETQTVVEWHIQVWTTYNGNLIMERTITIAGHFRTCLLESTLYLTASNTVYGMDINTDDVSEVYSLSPQNIERGVRLLHYFSHHSLLAEIETGGRFHKVLAMLERSTDAMRFIGTMYGRFPRYATSTDGNRVAFYAGDEDRTILVYDRLQNAVVSHATVMQKYRGEEIMNLQFCDDDKRLVITTSSHVFLLFRFSIPCQEIHVLRFDPTGRLHPTKKRYRKLSGKVIASSTADLVVVSSRHSGSSLEVYTENLKTRKQIKMMWV